MMSFIFLLLAALLQLALGQNPSPCPDVFLYEPNKPDEDRWYGTVSIRSTEDLIGVYLNILLDRPAQLLGNWFGDTSSTDNTEFIIINQKYKLEAGPPVSVRFFVKYNPATVIPSIKSIRLNGRTICPPQDERLRPTTERLHLSQTRPGNTQRPETDEESNIIKEPNSNVYGRPTSSSDNQGGRTSRPIVQSVGTNTETRDRQSSTSSNVREPSRNVYGRPTSSIDNQEGRPSRPNVQSVNTHTDSRDKLATVDSSERGPSSNAYSTPTSSIDNQEGKSSRHSVQASGTNTDTTDKQAAVSANEREPSTNVYRRPISSNDNQRERPSRLNVQAVDTNTDTRDRQSSISSSERPNYLNNNNGIVLSDDSDEESFFVSEIISSISSNLNRPEPTDNRPSANPLSNLECGTVAPSANALISNGEDTKPGQWPWHTALYYSKGVQLLYSCGATLITQQHVLTAAHCVTKPHTNETVNKRILRVYLGKFNLIDFNNEVQERGVINIEVYPNYNYSNFFNDIAVLKLSKPVEINNYVRPVCLWDEDSDLDSIIGKPGTVVGWGFDQNKRLSNKLMRAQMPIVSTTECLFSNRDFFPQFVFENNFCAGYKNGTSACNGDSGGGMVFPKFNSSRQNPVWQIRGIVSVGVALQNQGLCDTRQFIVFTDVAKYTHWIRQIITF